MHLEPLKQWFHQNRREFLWREERTPYRVWIAEVMLQQTRAEVVADYFLRWMAKFPNIETLAKAPLESVIKCWEGLGYYSRARNIHKAAKALVDSPAKALLSSREELLLLPGIGNYTAEAILAFGFQKKAYPIDANVERVFSRFFLIEEDVKKPQTKKKIFSLMEQILPSRQSWVFAEAFIELGALICKKIPICEECPLKKECLAYKAKRAESLPVKTKKQPIIFMQRTVFILENKNFFLAHKEKKKALMADLYQFPYIDKMFDSCTGCERAVFDLFGLRAVLTHELKMVFQTFTCYKVELHPSSFRVEKREEIKNYQWIGREQLLLLPFSSGHRKIVGLLNGKKDTAS